MLMVTEPASKSVAKMASSTRGQQQAMEYKGLKALPP